MVAIPNPRYKLVIAEFWIRDVLSYDKSNQFIRVLKNDIDNLYSHYNKSGESSSQGGSSKRLTSSTPSLDDTWNEFNYFDVKISSNPSIEKCYENISLWLNVIL